MKSLQDKMQRLLETLVRDGHERGIQLAVYLDGELVVDAFAGVADIATGRAVESSTLFPVFSVTKGMAATMAHRVVEKGLIEYDTPLVDLWPEFAAQGKSGITFRHALNHMAGMQYMPVGIGYAELCDWRRMCEVIAAMRPVSPPGAQRVYHAVTFSWLVGEVMCRATGKSFGQLLEDEICRPAGIGDMYVGIPDSVEPRVAVLDEIFEPGKEPQVDDSKPQSIPGWIQPLHTMMNRADARRACIPSSSGIMTAKALAKHYAVLIPGGAEGVELLPPARMAQATTLQNPNEAPPARMGLGYSLGTEGSEMGSRHSAFGHGGYGGSIGFADPEIRLAVGLTKNLFSKNGATKQILAELREALGVK